MLRNRSIGFFCALLVVLSGVVSATGTTEEGSECEAGFRLFDHPLLVHDPICIPEHPERIVSLDMTGTEFLLLNDAPLVGAFAYVAREIIAITPKLDETLEDVHRFDWPPNLERLTELQPDVIVAFSDANLDLTGVEEIAPLVIYDPTMHRGDWRPSAELYSELFQLQDAFDAMAAIYDTRVEELRTALGEDRGDVEVSLFLPTLNNPLVWLQDSAPGRVLDDVGLGRPEFQINPTIEIGQSGRNWGFVNISLERLDLVDGDEIFISTWTSADPERADANRRALEDFHANNELWHVLNGVQAGNVHIVGGHWFRAQTYLQVNLMLDDLFIHLTDVEPTIPSPAVEWSAAEVTS